MIEARSCGHTKYINVEDLVRPNALLTFLNARGHHSPDNFAYSDLELSPLYKGMQEFLDYRKDNFTMAFLGRTSADTYGAFISWGNATAVKEAIDTGRSVHVDHGIQILQIQIGIFDFLCQCVSQILEDAPIYTLVKKIEPPQLMDGTGLRSIVSREAAYKIPSCLDLVSSRVSCSCSEN